MRRLFIRLAPSPQEVGTIMRCIRPAGHPATSAIGGGPNTFGDSSPTHRPHSTAAWSAMYRILGFTYTGASCTHCSNWWCGRSKRSVLLCHPYSASNRRCKRIGVSSGFAVGAGISQDEAFLRRCRNTASYEAVWRSHAAKHQTSLSRCGITLATLEQEARMSRRRRSRLMRKGESMCSFGRTCCGERCSILGQKVVTLHTAV